MSVNMKTIWGRMNEYQLAVGDEILGLCMWQRLLDFITFPMVWLVFKHQQVTFKIKQDPAKGSATPSPHRKFTATSLDPSEERVLCYPGGPMELNPQVGSAAWLIFGAVADSTDTY